MCPSDDLITAACLDSPRTGPVDGYAFEVVGWVVSKAPVAEVEFVHERRVVARCELDVSRPDVAKVYGGSSQVGFSKAIGTVGLAPAFTIEVRVVFQDGRRRVIAEIRGTQQLTSAFTPSEQKPYGSTARKGHSESRLSDWQVNSESRLSDLQVRTKIAKLRDTTGRTPEEAETRAAD